MFVRSRELITKVLRAQVARSTIRERIGPQQAEGVGITLQQASEKVEKPMALRRGCHRLEPHQPVEPQVIRRHLRRPSPEISWFPVEFVLAPLCAWSQAFLIGALEHDLV